MDRKRKFHTGLITKKHTELKQTNKHPTWATILNEEKGTEMTLHHSSETQVHRHKKAKIPKPVLDNSHIYLSLQKLGNPPESWHLDKNRRGKNAHASEMLNLSRKRGSTVGKHHLIKRKKL